MIQRVYHGDLTPDDVAQDLEAYFNRGNYIAQVFRQGDYVTVQISTRPIRASGGQTAITISIRTIEDGLAIQLGEQSWYGVAASLGATVFSALRNPFSLLGRLDDVAQDIESIQLTEDVWKIIDKTAASHRSSFELSERLRRLECVYCGAANPVGEATCVACGAPLGDQQPVTCSRCGFVSKKGEIFCPNCGNKVRV
jgi:DNA-directed RNA polymerase subunit RPC12/RpoP